MPAGGNVLLAAALVLRREVLFVDDELAVVHQTCARFALHAVHKRFVHGPGVDAAFGAVVVVDRATIEAEGLGLPVELACGQPGLACFGQGGCRGLRREGADGRLHGLGCGQGVAVVRVNQVRVVRHHLRGRDRSSIVGGCGQRDGPVGGCLRLGCGGQAGQCHHGGAEG